jgi:hypothetical protein
MMATQEQLPDDYAHLREDIIAAATCAPITLENDDMISSQVVSDTTQNARMMKCIGELSCILRKLMENSDDVPIFNPMDYLCFKQAMVKREED